MLTKIYQDLTAAGKNFEVVFVSSDREQGSFDEYFGTMPWTALPYVNRSAKAELSKTFSVTGIPCLVLIDENGRVITKKGVQAVMAGGQKEFPWRPKTPQQLMGPTLVTKSGEVPLAEAIAGKTIALYFSAHWCVVPECRPPPPKLPTPATCAPPPLCTQCTLHPRPFAAFTAACDVSPRPALSHGRSRPRARCPPCRRFTPMLAKLYTDMKAAGRDDFEIIFVSWDNDEEEFDEYYGEQPWATLPYGTVQDGLTQKFGVEGIPNLITIGPDGEQGTF